MNVHEGAVGDFIGGQFLQNIMTPYDSLVASQEFRD